MPSDREERIADFVTSFRVEPGSKVSLEKDFDPAFKNVGSKKKGRKVLATLPFPCSPGELGKLIALRTSTAAATAT